MSCTERNKGTLEYLFDLTEPLCEQYHEVNNLEKIGYDYIESLMEHKWSGKLPCDLMALDGKVFRVNYEIESDTDEYMFADVVKLDEGVYQFHTMHYNSCGLEEVIEDELKKLN